MAEIAGLKLIVPSSVAGSGVSVSASGKVTFTAATSVSVNGCFTSTYDNYLIVCRGSITTSGQGIYFRYRLSGTDASGANYTQQYLEAESTSVTSSRSSSQTAGRATGWNNASQQGFHWYMYGPALAQPSAWRSVSINSYLSATIADYAGTHSLSTAYDGFTMYPTGNNITGALCIYGLSQ
jgi:hypothetical protein